MTSVDISANKLPSLTGYRFLLAFAVLFGHVVIVSGIFPLDHAFMEAEKHSTVLAAGAVSSFFVLSGFILTWTRRADDTVLRFWRRRFVKIFPNHVVTLALVSGLALVMTTPTMLPVQEPTAGPTVANLFLVHTWLPNFEFISSGTGVTWSLAAELLFYLLFPVIIGPLCAVRANRIWPAMIVVAGAIITVPAIAALASPGDTALPGMSITVETWWLVYFFPPVRILEFVLGILLARAVLAGRWTITRVVWPALVLAAVVAVTPELSEVYLWGAATCVPAAAMIATIARRDAEHGPVGWLSGSIMVRLGEASYALYLVHIPVTFAMVQLIGPGQVFSTMTATLIALATMVASVLASLALWRTVEMPMMRRFARPRRRPERSEQSAGVGPAA